MHRLTASIFDKAPSVYDRFRPGYPEAAVEPMVELAQVPPAAVPPSRKSGRGA